MTGEQHDRSLAAFRDGGADGIRQTGAEMAEVLVPDDVVRLGLRVRPPEDHGGAAVAHHDAVLRKGLGGLDDETCGVDRRAQAGTARSVGVNDGRAVLSRHTLT